MSDAAEEVHTTDLPSSSGRHLTTSPNQGAKGGGASESTSKKHEGRCSTATLSDDPQSSLTSFVVEEWPTRCVCIRLPQKKKPWMFFWSYPFFGADDPAPSRLYEPRRAPPLWSGGSAACTRGGASTWRPVNF